MPKESLNQTLAIANLNKYLEWHNLPVRMNAEGVCKGLACVHAKYVLEGREDEYFRLLEKIAVMDKRPQANEELDRFVLEVVLSFMPNVWEKERTQRHSIESLQIGINHLKPSFSFGLIANDMKWISIIQSLKLRQDEVVLVDFVSHAINIRALDQGQYKIYNPNYDSGYKIVDGEKELLAELHAISDRLGITGANLGLSMQVIRHPDHPRKDFPPLREIYEHIAPKGSLITRKGKVRNNVHFAVLNDDVLAFEQLLKAANRRRVSIADEIIDAAGMAVVAGGVKVLEKMIPEVLKLPKQDRDGNLAKLINMALITGRKDTFDILLKNKQCHDLFHSELLKIKHAAVLIDHAASGGNIELLQEVIQRYKAGFALGEEGDERLVVHPPLTPKDIAEKILERNAAKHDDAIESAIKSSVTNGMGNVRCVEYLFEQLKEAHHQFDEKQMHDYLLLAIKTNQPHMVALLIKEIQSTMSEESQERIRQSIDMNIMAVEQTDSAILRDLKNWGVRFSEIADGIIQQKEKRPVGILLTIGIYLAKFSDWLHETTAKYHIEKFQGLKKDVQEMRGAEQSKKSTKEEESVVEEDNTPKVAI